MIVKEPYETLNSSLPLFKIYSDKRFLIQSNGLVYQEAIVREEDISKYTETSIAIPAPIADAYFVYNTFLNEEIIDIKEEQILSAKNLLIKALTSLTDEEAYQISFLFDSWDQYKQYKIGDRVLYNKELYTVIKVPNNNLPPSLNQECYKKTSPPKDLIEEWTQKNYNIGDRVKVGDHIYESLINNNNWSPQDFPMSWKLVE